MTPRIVVTVYGTPVPQGSMKAFVPKGWRRPIITSDNTKLRPWRSAVVDAVRQVWDAEPLDCAVMVRVHFWLPRPKSLPKRVTRQTSLPDLDKLVRAILDALTDAGAWRDDSRVSAITARKDFAGGMHDPRGAQGIPRACIEVLEVDNV